MFDLSHPIQLYRSPNKSGFPVALWICEWQSIGISSIPGGVFLVNGGHYFDVKQTAKKVLRDGIVQSGRFEFTVRCADLAERTQLKAAPAGIVLEAVMPKRTPLAGDKDFVDDSSTDLEPRPG